MQASNGNRAESLSLLGALDQGAPSRSIDQLMRRGVALQRSMRFGEAALMYRTVLEREPIHPRALLLLGVCRSEEGYQDEAISLVSRSLEIDGDQPAGLAVSGDILRELGRYEEALASFDRVIALNPTYAEAWDGRGVSLRALGQYEQALASFDKAIALNPANASAWEHRGAALRAIHHYEEALFCLQRAIALNPERATVYCMKHFAIHVLGELAEDLDQWRHWGERPRNFLQPLWLGRENVRDKTLLLYAFGGFGDSIQFCRYAPLLSARGARVVIEIQAELRSLTTTLEDVSQVIVRGDPIPHYDLRCSFPILPLAFGTTATTIPSKVPYLKPNPDLVAMWRSRLAALGKGLRVGIVWSGLTRVPEPLRSRSIPFPQFEKIADVPGVIFISLQKNEAASQAWHSSVLARYDWMDEVKDFADTAALIECLDLVISIDTSVAHLGGAIGKPVWLLNRFNPDWRWHQTSSDSPWYPTLRQFRQSKPGDWHSVIVEVRMALLEAAAHRRRTGQEHAG
jgi:tetratricopeptide (TPR) repeat protein